MRDIHSNIAVFSAFNTTNLTSSTTTNGNIIDLQGCNGVEFVLISGTLTDGVYVPELQHGNESDLSDATAVPDIDLINTESNAAFISSEDNKAKKIGYIGNKRYVRLNIRTDLITTGGTMTVVAVKGYLGLAPDDTDYTS